MVTYKEVCSIGDMLRKNNFKYLTLYQLSKILMKRTNSQGSNTIRKYLEILKHEGYIKATTVDGVPMLEVIYG